MNKKMSYLSVCYSGFCQEKDNKIESICKKNGAKFDGSGYCFIDGTRDLGFIVKTSNLVKIKSALRKSTKGIKIKTEDYVRHN